MAESKRARLSEEEEQARTDAAIEELVKLNKSIETIIEGKAAEIETIERKYFKKCAASYEKRKPFFAKIANFWPTVLSHHPVVSDLLSPEDLEVMQHLTDVSVELGDDPGCYKVIFSFKENPFFSNKTIVKEYNQDGVVNPTIQWKPGKNLVDPDEGESGKKRPLEDIPLSFFQWFTEEGDQMEADLGDYFKDEIYPDPLSFYFAREDSDEDDFDGDEGDEDDEGDEGAED
eukprot:Rmarinus@m.27311